MDRIQLAQNMAQVLTCCEHGNETLGSISDGEVFNQLNHYQLLRKVSAPWSKLFWFIYLFCSIRNSLRNTRCHLISSIVVWRVFINH